MWQEKRGEDKREQMEEGKDGRGVMAGIEKQRMEVEKLDQHMLLEG